MFNFKSQLLGIAAVLPVAAAGLLGSAGSAQAAALIGDFALSGNGNATLSLDSLTFNNPTTFDIIDDGTVDSFTGFTLGDIGNIISFSGNSADNPWLDLGIDAGSIADGLNTFELTAADYVTSQNNAFVDIQITAHGIFKSATGELSKGQAFLTLQKFGNKATLDAQLASGGSITGLTYSGVSFAATAVPEPTTMLGLGLVAAGMTVARRRKVVKA
ncbi:PEP-CTERM sorting domain-containing protein [Okeanomitos corallinicola TIOX110]|uniref:PEP-CTERM sorting domain-containing protein n=1 Tax=Okeanomitos corallinicola TIOX110 TaxID=3133117 RepID=A0ABZ2USC3_9CYAN